ncbi:SusC/RagA family TonB-linked outer membrane protein [Sphingobacterium sp. xlx-130]|uniref:SusC/RagA family TonB-linked outer membrane protein n=1 Tax=Sphingobacterium sp. xlx-130 TaxID=2654323 RepID=UPI0013DB7C67|nr:SusC/RagA family TonB-linked outer membrane protein [Sphingobacterium sp. xlx-130]
MRLTTVILLCSLMYVSAETFAQKINISKKKTTLESLFLEIGKQTGYGFIYSADALKNTHLVDIDIKNASLAEALKLICNDQPILLEIQNKTVFVKDKPIHSIISSNKSEEDGELSENIAIDIKGIVIDANNKSIKGVTVRLKGTRSFILTKDDGSFLFRNVSEGQILVISCVGYVPREIKAKANIGKIVLERKNNQIEQAEVRARRSAGTQLDLKDKLHQNLGQILEGGVPGLTMQPLVTSTPGEIITGSKGLTIKQLYEGAISNSNNGAENLQRFPTYEDFLRGYNWFSNASTKQLMQTNSNAGLIPQMLGASSFGAETSGMLVVIDGFPQEGFPSDFPMNNVESIEIVTDPEECLKWGPKASGGIIFITTKRGEPGKVRINYRSNIYFSRPSDNSLEAMQLASSVDVLDYYKEAFDRKLVAYYPKNASAVNPGTLSPAETFLFELGKGTLSQEQFQVKWDSLSLLNNRDQLRSLEQNIFNQNHSLQLSGGSKIYQYAFNGLYRKNISRSIGSHDEGYGLGMHNNLRLLNGKLTASLLVNLNNTNGRITGSQYVDYDPYQMLFDERGNYAYYQVDAQLNDRMMAAGYFNSGVNLYEDALSNYTKTSRNTLNSDLKINYSIFKGLNWVNSFRISRSTGTNNSIVGANSSEARLLFNDYGVIVPNTTTNNDKPSEVIYYVPVGDMLRKTNTSGFEYRLNSGLSFSQTINQSHQITSSINFGLASNSRKNNPFKTLYGYNDQLEAGYPFLEAENDLLTNFQGDQLDFAKLNRPAAVTDNITRNINFNGDFRYSFNNRYEFNLQYLSNYQPNFGRIPVYSGTVSKRGGVAWNLGNEQFFVDNIKFMNKLKLHSSISSMSVPDLPRSSISANRFDQTSWGNSAIIINSFNYAEQSGQSNNSITAGIDAGFFKNSLLINWKYDKNSKGNNAWNGRLKYDIASSKYFNSSLISQLNVGLTVQNINPFAGMQIMMESNSVTGGGGTSTPIESTSGLLPPSKLNKEVVVNLGILSNRYTFSGRLYDNNTSGLAQGSIPADPSSGLSSKVNYSRITNRGIAFSFSANFIRKPEIQWRVILNAAYNENRVLEIPEQSFSLRANYLSALRTGYTTDNLWSYNWAGLDTLGNPQFFNGQGDVISLPDGTSVIYSGRKRAPYSGGLSTNLDYKGLFVSVRSVFNWGHVMRRYIPQMTASLDRSNVIKDRWRKPGDENITDVPAMAMYDSDRILSIQNASNTVLTADHIRITEIQLGYRVPRNLLKGLFVKGITISGQVENPFLWVRNDLGVDPEAVSTNGTIGLSRPKNYVMSISLEM